MCAYFEDNDEEEFTIADLANKMKEYLNNNEPSAYNSISSLNY